MAKSIYITAVLVVLWSCTLNKSNNEIIQASNDYIIIEEKDKEFELDENTTQNTTYIQFDSKNNALCFTNEYDNSITINDFKNGKFIKKIYFNKEGSDGIGKISNFFIHDSLIYIYNHWAKTIFITDTNAIVKSKTIINLDSFLNKGINPPAIWPRPLSPLNIVNNNLILCGYQIDRINETAKNTPSMMIYNLTNNSIIMHDGYPELYHTGNWGINPTYRFIGYTVSNNKIIISYPCDKYIYMYENNKIKKRFFAGTNNDDIKAISQNRSDKISFNQEDDHYMKNTIYGGVFYDNKNNIYYRIILLPTEKKTNKTDEIYNKNIQIIALDSTFNIIARHNASSNIYLAGISFISNEGLHVKIKSENDDIMKFKTFKIKKKI